MKIKDVLRQLGKDLGIPQSKIDAAIDFANAAGGQGEEAKAAMNKELTNEQAETWRLYGLLILRTCIKDPEFKKKFIDETLSQIERN